MKPKIYRFQVEVRIARHRFSSAKEEPTRRDATTMIAEMLGACPDFDYVLVQPERKGEP